MARERTLEGEPIYHPRDDVRPEVSGGNLLLTLLGPDVEPIVERFATGDRARPCRGGWVIRNPDRLHPEVEGTLESWGEADWRRRTGYVRREAETTWIQLREGETPRAEETSPGTTELAFFDFASRFGFSWLDKPYWR